MMNETVVKRWLLPPQPYMIVKISDDCEKYDRYISQSSGTTGQITEIRADYSTLKSWARYTNMLEDIIVRVQWAHGGDNLYRLKDLVPTGYKENGTEYLQISGGYELPKNGDYRDELIRHIVTNGRHVKKTITKNAFDVINYYTLILENLKCIEHDFLNGKSFPLMAEVNNAFIDKKAEYETNNEQIKENIGSGEELTF